MATNKKGPKDTVKSFSYVYVIFAVLGFIAAIAVLFIPNLNETLKQVVQFPDNVSPKVFIETSIIVSSLVDLWLFWLVRRYVNGKSKGYFYIVLLVLGIVSGIVGIFTGKGSISINFIIDVVGLILMIRAKKAEK